ncbi:Uncharacterised protein [Streptococcus pneumoniae]|nr:Uncharacterised protein [Streptococcus pneumoniae]CJD44825.1 Uncharacterised protein [Streptococcus pneumoniae]CJG68807.1 Uncharacterised protein [Streptococcus pneumoniae]
MVANIVDVDSLFNAIFDTCKDTSNIGFSDCTWAKASRIWKQGFQKLNWNNFLAVKVNGIRTKESNIFKTFHVRQVRLTKSHKETNAFDTWNVLGQ